MLLIYLGHGSDTRLVSGTGDLDVKRIDRPIETILNRVIGEYKNEIQIPLQKCFASVVLVSFWDEENKILIPAGSGFIADASEGLILTAAHCVVDNSELRKNCYEIFIGVLPKLSSGKYSTQAVFRYRAQLVKFDSEYRVDACVLKIITKLEDDMLPTSTERPTDIVILANKRRSFFEKENLRELKICTEKLEIGDFLHILGYVSFIFSAILSYVFSLINVPLFFRIREIVECQ